MEPTKYFKWYMNTSLPTNSTHRYFTTNSLEFQVIRK